MSVKMPALANRSFFQLEPAIELLNDHNCKSD